MSKEKIYKVLTASLSIEKSKPPRLVINSAGEVNTGGWSNGVLQPYVYVQPPADGIYEFEFRGDPPSGASTQVISPIKAKEYVWASFPEGLKGVRIYAETNSIEELLPVSVSSSGY